MDRIAVFIFAWIILLVPQIALANTQACNAILEHGIADIVTSSNATDFEHYLHQSICYETDGSLVGHSRASVNVLFDVIGFGASRGVSSIAEYKEEYCGEFASQRATSALDILSVKRLSQYALSAWARCVEATNGGWQPRFDPIDERTIAFRLTYGGPGVVRITGIRITSDEEGSVSCHTGVESIDPEQFEPVTLSTEGWSMICKRDIMTKLVDGRSYRYGPSSTISVLAGGTIFSLAIPEYRRPMGPVDELRKELREVRDQIALSIQGAIIPFAQECPPGWDEYEKTSGRFLLGAGELEGDEGTIRPGDSEGSFRHDHGRTGDGGSSARWSEGHKTDDYQSNADHTHEVSEIQHLPPYLGVVFCTWSAGRSIGG